MSSRPSRGLSKCATPLKSKRRPSRYCETSVGSAGGDDHRGDRGWHQPPRAQVPVGREEPVEEDPGAEEEHRRGGQQVEGRHRRAQRDEGDEGEREDHADSPVDAQRADPVPARAGRSRQARPGPPATSGPRDTPPAAGFASAPGPPGDGSRNCPMPGFWSCMEIQPCRIGTSRMEMTTSSTSSHTPCPSESRR